MHVFYNSGNRHNRLMHVRAIVDGSHAVVRTWYPGWGYELMPLERIRYAVEHGNAKIEHARKAIGTGANAR